MEILNFAKIPHQSAGLLSENIAPPNAISLQDLSLSETLRKQKQDAEQYRWYVN